MQPNGEGWVVNADFYWASFQTQTSRRLRQQEFPYHRRHAPFSFSNTPCERLTDTLETRKGNAPVLLSNSETNARRPNADTPRAASKAAFGAASPHSDFGRHHEEL